MRWGEWQQDERMSIDDLCRDGKDSLSGPGRIPYRGEMEHKAGAWCPRCRGLLMEGEKGYGSVEKGEAQGSDSR